MYLPRADRSFGSDYIFLQLSNLNKERKNGTILTQMYELDRAHWKSLDSEERRCDTENKNYVAKCVIHFLENLIGCSMGMTDSDNGLGR